MALKTYEPGDVVFLKLEGDFVPAWRQGLVASVSRKKGTIYLVVRVLDKELENKESGLTSFDLEQNKFILVQGSAKKLRSQCGASTHRALEIDTKMLLDKAVTVLSEGDLQWVTASEDLEESHKTVTKHLEPSDEESDSSGESGDSGEDILKLLKRANRTQPAGATGSENVESSRSKSKGRFVLLEGRKKHSKDEEKIDMDGLIMKSLAGAASSGNVDLNALLQMQILKQLQGKKGKKKDSLESAESSGSSEEDSSSEEKVRLKGAGKALKAYRQTHRAMKKQPLKHVKRYVREIKEQLGATNETPFSLSDWSKRINWGKNKSLMRLHYGMSEVLKTLLKGKSEQAALQLTNLLRATHQCSLDGGNWKVAWLLTHLADPLDRPRFGGEAQSLEIIASYVRAMGDLEKRSKWMPTAADEELDKEPRKVKGKGRGKKGEEGTGE